MGIYHSFMPQSVGEKIVDYYKSSKQSSPQPGGFQELCETQEASVKNVERIMSPMSPRNPMYFMTIRGTSVAAHKMSDCATKPEIPSPTVADHKMSEYATTLETPSPIVIWDVRAQKIGWDEEAVICKGILTRADQFCRRIYKVYPVNFSESNHMITALIHDRAVANNACWDGNVLRFGECDPNIMTPIVRNADITNHELGHAVTQLCGANFKYQGQSGALNESMSDVFAIVAKHFAMQTRADQANWLLADGLLNNPRGTGTAIRSLSKPGTAYQNHHALGSDTQPDHMSGYAELPVDIDFGGVHMFCGIPNRAFYEASCRIQGNTWEKSAMIWWRTQAEAPPDSDFATFASMSIQVAEKEYGNGVGNCVGQAWSHVGVSDRVGSRKVSLKESSNKKRLIIAAFIALIAGGCGLTLKKAKKA